MDYRQFEMKTKIGKIFLVASQCGLRGLFLSKQPVSVIKELNGSGVQEQILKKTVSQLEEYFSGQRQQFDIALDIEGTVFQRKVWDQLLRIPFGSTVSYKEIAKKIKNPKAMRAVGNANGKNPLCIIIPCHRVIANDGTIGGYSGGIHIKQMLLKHEGIG